MTEKEFRKYAKRATVAAAEPALPERCPLDGVVIPACDEEETLPRALDSLRNCDGGRTPLILVVLNHPAGASDRVAEATFRTAAILRQRRLTDPNLYWLTAPGISGGVGAARKLGFDTLLAHLLPEQAEETLFYSFDADTLAAKAYFSAVRARFEAEEKLDALTLGFRHQTGETPALETAIRRYEAYLHRYVKKLAESGSPYAFHTIGSAFAVRASSYLRAGGMRVRSCGEDFYFLQAVAKTGCVKEESAILVHPSARPSMRVPFGTGPALRQLLAGETLNEIPDEAFECLRETLTAAHRYCVEAGCGWLEKLPAAAQSFLASERFSAAWQSIAANTPPEQQSRAFDVWFDGLKTLRFLHFLAEPAKKYTF